MTMPTRNSDYCSSPSTSGSQTSENGGVIRQQRNLAEKQRRDKMNGFINELATLVPFATISSKKLDKTSILRLSAAYLRLQQSLANPRNFKQFSWQPDVLDSLHLTELLKVIDGFLIVITSSGKIIFASKLIENYLGHQDIEMIGHTIFFFIHPTDLEHVKDEIESLLVRSYENKGSFVRATFCARMRERGQPRSEIMAYQTMRFNCCMTTEENSEPTNRKQRIFTRQRKITGNDVSTERLLKIFVKPVIIDPRDDLTITEAFQEEYVTRHGTDGRILFADHRISTITGHLPHEVTGMLAYDYIFPEDVPIAHFAQKLMFSSSNGVGMIVYRLKARNSTAVYLKTIGHLQYDQKSTKVSHFICINKMLGKEEGEKELKKFTERYRPHAENFLALTESKHVTTVSSRDERKLLENIISRKSRKSTRYANQSNSALVVHSSANHQYSPPTNITSDKDFGADRLSTKSIAIPNGHLGTFDAQSPSEIGSVSSMELTLVTDYAEPKALNHPDRILPGSNRAFSPETNTEVIEECIDVSNSAIPSEVNRETVRGNSFPVKSIKGLDVPVGRRKRNAEMSLKTQNGGHVEIPPAPKQPRYNGLVLQSKVDGTYVTDGERFDEACPEENIPGRSLNGAIGHGCHGSNARCEGNCHSESEVVKDTGMTNFHCLHLNNRQRWCASNSCSNNGSVNSTIRTPGAADFKADGTAERNYVDVDW